MVTRSGFVGGLACAVAALVLGGCLGPGGNGSGTIVPIDSEAPGEVDAAGGDADQPDEGEGDTKQPGGDAGEDAETPDAVADVGEDAHLDVAVDAVADVPGDEGGDPDGAADVPGDVGPGDVGPDTVCLPQCGGKQCGSDGCGGSCGACGAGKSCDAAGKCVETPTCAQVTKIGCCDGAVLWTCSGGQVASEDCGAAASCGWSADEGGYACGTDGQASPDGLAPLDCPWKCEPQCDGRECGDDGCGGSCGTCGAGAVCVDAGLCVGKPTCAQVTKVGCCDGGTLWTCEGGVVEATACGEDGPCGWDEAQGGYACGTDGGGSPDGTYPQACGWICYPQCGDKECGPDGCGGSCGKCGLGETCDLDGTCCAPACDGKACGGDGCGGSCGTCGLGEVCGVTQQCVSPCVSCEGRECGADGCGGSCGTCGLGEVCTSEGQCVTQCTPQCDGKQCGPNGCGGSCGTCQVGQFCSPQGTCSATCTPQCGGKQCGPDGCGGTCGTCDAGVSCTVAGQCGSGCLACDFAPECLAFGFESGNLAGWQVTGQSKVVKSFHGDGPAEGAYLLDLSSEGTAEAKVAIQTCVPKGATAVRFLWRVYSAEFLEWCGSTYQDYFRVALAAGGQPTVAFERTINQLCPKTSACSTCGEHGVPLVKTELGFDQSAGGVYKSDWQVGYAPLGALADNGAATVTLSFAVGDVGDSVYDTHVLVDDIQFVVGCAPSCEAGGCGDDGCGEVCGLCSFGAECVEGTCEADCTPDCTDKTCGGDGCGGSCGTCGAGTACEAGACVDAGDGGMGQACTADAECADGLVCKSNLFGGTTQCTVTCSDSVPCPTGYSCFPDFGGGSYCF